ncbi:MAG: adenine phosphoribosyltransferase [Zavarzinella sp.]
MNLFDYIRDVPDFPKPGIMFKDITPLLSNPQAFQHAVQQLAAPFLDPLPDVIAAAEARGFLFAAPLALAMQRPLVPLRKPGKLPYSTHSLKYDLEYGSAELHMHVDAVKPGDKVLLIDDVLATGGTMRAAIELIRNAGGEILACGFLMELAFLKGKQLLDGIPSHSVLVVD